MGTQRSTTRKQVPSVEELVTKVVEGEDRSSHVIAPEDLDPSTELGTQVEGTDGTKRVLVSLDWLNEIEARLERAERPVVTKVKDALVENKRKIVLAGSTVLALSAAAYVVTHREELVHDVEKAVEVGAEKTEHGFRDVKKAARKERTGSTIKNSARDK